MEQRSKRNPSICSYCGRSFSFNSSLIKHIRIHTGERPYICNYENCHHSFSQISNLVRHKKIHFGIKPFTCKKCPRSFTSTSNLKQHVLTHENQEVRKRLICFIKNCSKEYLYLSTLKKHVKTFHVKEYELVKKKQVNSRNFFDLYINLKKNVFSHDFIEFKEVSLDISKVDDPSEKNSKSISTTKTIEKKNESSIFLSNIISSYNDFRMYNNQSHITSLAENDFIEILKCLSLIINHSNSRMNINDHINELIQAIKIINEIEKFNENFKDL